MYNWKKFILGCSIGNVFEMYNWVLYGYFSPILASLFFPATNKSVALMLTFSIFASGCLVRPLGAMLFGHFGDRLGRKSTLILSIGMMSLATTLVGLLPTYQQAGILAPALLILCRLLQGVSISGEAMGAAIFLTENSPANKQGFAGSIIMASGYLGLLLGSLITLLLMSMIPEKELTHWGWRIPFLLSFVFGSIALLIRIKQGESSQFMRAKEQKQIVSQPIVEVFCNYLPNVITAILLCALLTAAVYLLAIYMPSYFSSIAGLGLRTSMLISSFNFLLVILCIILVGHWSDKVGPKVPMLISVIGFILSAYPIFLLLSYHTLLSALFAQFLLGILLAFAAGSVTPILISLFPVKVRCTGIFLGWNLSIMLFGSTAPIIVLALTNYVDIPHAAFLYIIFVAIVTFFATIKIKINHSKVSGSIFK